MRFARVLVLTIIIILPGLLPANWRPGEMKIKLSNISLETIHLLYESGYTVDSYEKKNLFLYVIPSELEKLRRRGFDPEIIIFDMEAHSKLLLKSDLLDGYYDYYETLSLVDSLTSDFPDIIQKHVYGYSLAGRELYAVKISDNVKRNEPEPEIGFDGGHHGDELMSSEVLIRFMKELCYTYGKDKRLSGLVNSNEIWIYPFINPDGRQTLTRYNAAGVDLNRDWGFMWDGWGGSSQAFSQPETRAAAKWILENRFIISQSNHDGAEMISYPWSYRPEKSPDFSFIDYLARLYAKNSGYAMLHGDSGFNGLYPINGSAKDFFYGAMGSIGWTLEISRQKMSPDTLISKYYQANRSSFISLIEQADEGIKGMVTDVSTGKPVSAIIWLRNQEQQFWPVFTHPQTGDFRKFVLPGEYSIRITANGYQTFSIPTITIGDTGALQLNIALEPANGVFAQQIIASRIPGNNFEDDGLIYNLLGSPDSLTYSIGRNGWIILDFGREVPDLPGYDLKIIEGDDSPESYNVKVSSDWLGPWVTLGEGQGTTEFDLQSSGLSEFRYLWILDNGNGMQKLPDAGFDMDAVEARVIPQKGPFVMPVRYYIEKTNLDHQILLNFLFENRGTESASRLFFRIQDPNQKIIFLKDTVSTEILDEGAAFLGTFRAVLPQDIDKSASQALRIDIHSRDGNNWSQLFNVSFFEKKYQISHMDKVEFPPTFLNSRATIPVKITNLGDEVLHIHSISTSNEVFSTDQTSLAVPPETEMGFKVYFEPGRAEEFTDSLIIQLDNPLQLPQKIPIWGKGIASPLLEIENDSLFWVAGLNDTTSNSIVLKNRGAGELLFNIQTEITGMSGNTPDNILTENIRKYDFLSSNEPGGPIFNWFALNENNASSIPFTVEDNISEPIPLGFHFPFYGKKYATLRVSPRGWICFSTYSVLNNNLPLPNKIAPRAMIAPLMDNLHLREESQVLFRREKHRFRIQWKNMYTVTGAGPYTFELVLYPSGNILMQYQMLNDLDTSYTVGIQNVEATLGQTLAYNQSFLQEEMTLLIFQRSWLEVSPNGGRLPPSADQKITLRFNSTLLSEGDHRIFLRIDSNEPQRELLRVPVILQISGSKKEDEVSGLLPENTVLFQNYPNPFNPRTYITFQISEAGPTHLIIYNLLGQEIKVILQENLTVGEYQVEWDGTNQFGQNVPSGIYFYELKNNATVKIKKMILLR